MSFNGKAKYIDMTLGDSTSEEDVEEVEGEEQVKSAVEKSH